MPGPTQGITVRQTLDTQQDATTTAFRSVFPRPFAGYAQPGRLVNLHFRCNFLIMQQGAGGFGFRFNGGNSPMNAFRNYFDLDTGFVNMANYNSIATTMTVIPGGSTTGLLQFEGTFNATQNPLDLVWRQNSADPLPSSILVGSYMEIVLL